MSISVNLKKYKIALIPYEASLVAVSKTKPESDLKEAYDCGQRIFGENKVQELVSKAINLPNDIEWHMIGHLQRNKVKQLIPHVTLIHGVDSERLLKEINKQAEKQGLIIDILLQMHIAEEETKFGFSKEEILDLLKQESFLDYQNIRIKGLMGMATNTVQKDQVRKEFKYLKSCLLEFKTQLQSGSNHQFKELSMGMSGDYDIALEEGATLVRIGSAIFGSRNYIRNN